MRENRPAFAKRASPIAAAVIAIPLAVMSEGQMLYPKDGLIGWYQPIETTTPAMRVYKGGVNIEQVKASIRGRAAVDIELARVGNAIDIELA